MTNLTINSIQYNANYIHLNSHGCSQSSMTTRSTTTNSLFHGQQHV